jgi:hypothetical protein
VTELGKECRKELGLDGDDDEEKKSGKSGRKTKRRKEEKRLEASSSEEEERRRGKKKQKKVKNLIFKIKTISKGKITKLKWKREHKLIFSRSRPYGNTNFFFFNRWNKNRNLMCLCTRWNPHNGKK